MKVTATAPSNIALIKYMGKIPEKGNLPTNTSISYTLPHLYTTVEIESGASEDTWAPLKSAGAAPLELSQKGQERFLNHFSFLKEKLSLPGHYTISSSNNFPSDCGLASSASSFAALTMAAFQIARPDAQLDLITLSHLSELSRQGSGSSCRSFFEPWAEWRGTAAKPLEVPEPMRELTHLVVVAESKIKEISSSQAHKLVPTSLLFEGRTDRAEARAAGFTAALREADWRTCFEIAWGEFWDMHALFETAKSPFGYMTASSLDVLSKVRHHWKRKGDGPLVTMDAGPNVHLLFRQDQAEDYKELAGEFGKSYQVLGSELGGAQF